VLATGLLIPLSLFLQFFFSVPQKYWAQNLSLSLSLRGRRRKKKEAKSLLLFNLFEKP